MALGRTNAGGGGGGGFNFKVVKYNSTPSGTAKENTIGVVTDMAITGWKMQAEEPAGSQGFVWIQVAAESMVPFYADRKQTVRLYPVAVQQYLSGGWTNVGAYIYQQSSWKQFSSEIRIVYEYGVVSSMDDFTSIGTFSEKKETAEDGIYLGGNSSKRGGLIYTKSPVQLRAGNVVRFVGKVDASGSGNWKTTFFATKTVPTKADETSFTAVEDVREDRIDQWYDFELEIPSDGMYYLGFQAYEGGGWGCHSQLWKIWY